ncbi:phospholipase D/Transphosphatidylase [Aurantiacibacter atlanticus]|uniref:Phospholipase D n=1 Tax=Aurantiacibacter atlanticus TaxID=1648404 RepID=A0A0H4VBW1_9SPHN|nr:phospholipase D-like domain-containing protein [Aurantiacibacter atlanticus]AKQ42142.1 phospholipase D/Transphosphatidylase [Aurantiacibacter atlanticus]MDF1834168.1 phospholipase D-like domain-containing protein [Alteraurantiacibacter sp. bin_em_oilr2.035]
MGNFAEDVEGFDDSSTEAGVWQYAHARRVRVVVDGEDYFDLIQQAMLKARQRILLIGWDFDTRIHLSRGRRWWQRGWRRDYPSRLGSFILWLNRNRPYLEVRILKWSYGFIKFFGRGSMMLDILRWWRHRRIDFKFDTAHPVACSHHQKIVVIDDDFAVCGGIDMTTRRWDTRDHAENDKRRTRPDGRPYPPWHDVTMMMEGEVAGALDVLGRARWVRSGGKPLKPPMPDEGSAWPDGLEPHFENVEIGIARTRAEYDGDPKVDEIENLFVQQIGAAQYFIYIENQYLTSHTICEAIARRLAEPDPPEIVIIMPEFAEGWMEEGAMSPARAKLVQALREIDSSNSLHLYIPYSGETAIYVHAKLMIVDDRILRIGSANLNNRSMGLDSECDVFIDCERTGNAGATDAITRIRHSMLAEHLGIAEDEVPGLIDEHGSMSEMIKHCGTNQRRWLKPFHPPEPDEWLVDLALRETLDPEEPEDLFAIVPPGRGLFRNGSLLARARDRISRKRKKKHG